VREEYKNDIQKIKEILYSSTHAVFFGGAGVSTDSGIPDFRGTGGLYNGEGVNNEYFLSRECLANEPEKFYEFYRKNMVFPAAVPNRTHKALAKLESKGIIKAVITQNIDGLHQRAGSNRVIELHGTVSRFYCSGCNKEYSDECLSDDVGIPLCNDCGKLLRPAVVLYGESLDALNFLDAQNEIRRADVLIVGGSSLKVNPAASLLRDFYGSHLIIINYSPTPFDGYAEFVIRESISHVFDELI